MEAKTLVNWLARIPGDAVAVEDSAGNLVFVNGALCQALGYEPGELIGQPWVILFPALAQAPEQPVSHYETHLRRQDGSTLPALVTAWRLAIIGDPERRRLTVLVILKGLEPSQAGLGEKEELTKNHRVASVVHELNNSLTSITLHSELLSLLDPGSPRFGEHLGILQDQVSHMRRIVAELKVSSDPGSLQFETTDINALIRHTLDIQAYQLRLADVHVVTDLGSDLLPIQADAHRLEQVFVNLITNACQALADTTPPRVLWVSTRGTVGQNSCSSRIRIYFANNGPAISPDLLSRIFEPFFTTKAPGQGSGLGLTICARIVQAHRGQIWAESQVPTGVVFVVELPANAAAEADCKPEVPPRAAWHAMAGGTRIDSGVQLQAPSGQYLQRESCQ